MKNDNISNAEEYDERGGCGCNTSCTCLTTTNNSNKHKQKNCKSFSFVTKNPFDVAISKQLNNDEYIILLSGNHHSMSDYDHDKLPDWVAMGERPCRIYKTVTTDELINIWNIKGGGCGSGGGCGCDCNSKSNFKECHPNGFINYYLTNGTNRSQVVEIKEATVDVSQDDPTLILKVIMLSKGDDRLELDGLYSRMFRVSLVIDQYCQIPKVKSSKNRDTTIVQAPPSNYTFAPNYNQADYSKMMGPTVTTTQSTQQTSQQSAQQQMMGQPDNKDKKDKKDKKKNKKDKCKKLKGKEKKECEKKLKKQNKKQNKKRDTIYLEKKNLNSNNSASRGNKKDCKPWQHCWIKESGYDPTKDVHNIYYGFKDACQTALHPLEGCDPKKPVFSLPPPAGF